MPTLKQKRAVKVVVNGGSPTDGMREANYAPSVIRKPQVLTESKGYKEELARYGLTDELVTSSLVYDIEEKPKNRVAELRLASEILGINERTDKGDKTLILNIIGEVSKRYDLNTSCDTNPSSTEQS